MVYYTRVSTKIRVFREPSYRPAKGAMNSLARIYSARLVPILIALCFGIGHVADVGADNSVNVSVVGGERTARATSVTFETRTAPDGSFYQIGMGTLFIDDSSGSNAGWQVSIGTAEPAAPATVTDAGSRATAFVSEISSPIHLAGQSIDQVGGPFLPAYPIAGDLGTPRTVVVSESGFGKGRYRVELTIARELPVGVDDSSLPLSLSVTISPRS
jgi:hypothetical protein